MAVADQVEGAAHASPGRRRGAGGTVAVALALVVAVGLVVRLALVRFGLPDLNHPDEPTNIDVGTTMATSGSLTPDRYNYPSFLSDLVAVVVRLRTAVAGGLDGATVTQFQGFGISRTAAPGLVLGLRLTTVVASLAMCLVVGLGLAAVVRRRRPGLDARVLAVVAALPALLLAVAPVAVESGVYVTPDTWTGLFCALALVGALFVAADGSRRGYLLAGAGTGLAAGTKYNAALVGVALVVAHLYARRPGARPEGAGRRRSGRSDADLALGVGVAVLALLVTTPGLLIEPTRVLDGIRFELAHYRAGHPGHSGGAALAYAGALLSSAPLLLLLALGGVVSAVSGRRRNRASDLGEAAGPAPVPRREVVVVGSFAAAYAALLAVQQVHFARNLLPLLPALGLLGGLGVLALVDRAPAGRALRSSPSVVLAALVGTLAVAAATASSLALSDDLREPGRAEARQWLEDRLGPDAVVVRESYGPWLDPQRFPRLVYWTDPTAGPPPPDVDAVVLTERSSGRYLADPLRYPRQVEAYRRLTSTLCPGARFDEGPWVEILVPCR